MLSFVLESDCNAEFFAMLTWTIWFRRNKIRCAPLGFPLDQVSQRAFTSLMEFRAVQPKKQSLIARPRTKWKAPPGEMYKINFDGATFSDEGRAGIGVVIRNNQDMVMASMSHNVPLPISVVELETLAATKALEVSLDLGFCFDDLEGDLEIVMYALKDDSASLASFGLLIQEVKTYAEQFQCIRFSHVGREGNSIADNLARHAGHVTDFFSCG